VLESSDQPENLMAFIHYSASQIARPSSLNIVGADSVIGCTIIDRQGVCIGALRDIMLDFSTGRIAYAVIAMSGLRDGDNLIVVPWNVIQPDHDTQRLRVNAHADWIGRAPSVQPGHAPDPFVQEWGAFIHNYFGTRPYWDATPAQQQYS
jgi:sporulation protein YlmC with PRC-barrel domain